MDRQTDGRAPDIDRSQQLTLSNLCSDELKISPCKRNDFGLPLNCKLYQIAIFLFTSLQNDKILDWSKLKVFADDKINTCMTKKKIKICFGKSKKHCGKRRKCWLPAFFPFPTMFSNGFFLRVVKSRECVGKS